MAQFFTPKRIQKETKQTLKIDKHDHAGNGLCLSAKPIVVVANALEGETCQIKVSKQTKRANFAQATKILEASPLRTKAFCEYYDQCGGCSLQHTNAKNGLALKEFALREFVGKNLDDVTNNIDASTWDKPILSDIDYEAASATSQKTGYRRRIRLAIDARNKSSIRVGFRAANTQKIIDIQACPVALSSINSCLPLLRKALKQLPSISKVGHVVVTQGDHLLQVAIFITQKLCDKSLQKLALFTQNSKIVLLVIGQAVDPIIFQSGAPVQMALTNQDAILIEDKSNVKLNIKSTHFLQVNKAVNQKMMSSVHDWLSPKKEHTLYDFFCGSGNFALSLANEVHAVKGFEGINEMVEIAAQNAVNNGIDNSEFTTMDLSSVEALNQLSFDENAVVILDPSREGASVLCQFLATANVDKIVYVSCNPNSFVRDAAFLLPQFRLVKIKALDMFPFTKHIELMALFVKH